MNIFYLDKDPIRAAQMQCDQHVVKMILESAQMLCTAHPEGKAPYKRTHYNHPCSIWVRKSKLNYRWLCDHAKGLCEEYTFRYEKTHKTQEIIEWCIDHIDVPDFKEENFSHPPMAMPDEYKTGSVVESYRNFYLGEKIKFARWKKNRKPPFFVKES